MRESFLKFYSMLSASFRENEKRIRDVLFASFLFFSLVAVVFRVKANLEVPVFHMDGAFQTASSLFHLDAGHAIGKDFFPYLGIGTVYCLYPFFKLFGGNLMASHHAASFVCILTGAFIVATPISILRKQGNFRTFIFVFSLFLFLFSASSSIGSLSDFYWFNAFLHPGTSLRLLRSVLPYVVFFLIFFLLRQSWNGWVKTVVLGLLAGMAFLWSNDFAIPTVGVLFGISFLMFFGNGWKTWLYHGLLMFVVSISSAFATGMIICRGNYLDFCFYNIRDVTGDQFWYFGYYLPYFKVLSISDFIKKVLSPVGLYFCFLLFIVGMSLKTREHRWLLLSAIGIACFGATSLVQIGGHTAKWYQLFFSNWAWVSVAAVVVQAVFRVPSRYVTGYLCFFVILSIGGALLSWRNFAVAKVIAYRNPDFSYVPELGGVIGNKYVPYLDFARQNKEAICVEEYWGLWSALNRRFDNPKVDSIMHARGEVESVWIEKIQMKPDFVVTTRYILPEFETVYQAVATSRSKRINIIQDRGFQNEMALFWTLGEFHLWNFNVNYFFYSILLRNYAPFFASPTTVVWKRLDTPVVFRSVPITHTDKSFILEADEAGFYEISCEMEFAFSKRNILLIVSGITSADYAVFPLNQRQKPHVFPVYFDGVNREFSFHTVPESQPYRILLCSARRIALNDERVLPSPVEIMNLRK